MLQSLRCRLPFQLVHIHLQTMPLNNPPERLLASFRPQEQRHKVLRDKDYGGPNGGPTLSIAAKMAANRASTSARMPGCVKT